MNKKNILIVGNSFYPENSPRAFRTTELAKEFARQGHDVTVLVPKDNKVHEKFEKRYGLKIKNIGQKRFSAINLNSDNKIILLFKRLIRRSLDLFLHYPNIEWMLIVKKALRDQKDYDLLITIAAPHPIHWGTAWARNNKNKIARVWIADCGDPFMGTTTDTFKKLFYFKYFEEYWGKKSDYITVPIEGAKGGYYNEFKHKIKVIPQGFNFDEIKINEKDYTTNKTPTFAYAGLLIPGARDPKLLIEYLLSLNIDFKFIFYTKSIGLIAPYLPLAKGRIEVRDYIPRADLLEELSKMDFLVNFNNGVSTQLPSKLIDYYLTKRPVLSIDSFGLNTKIIDQFLTKDYANQFKFDNPEQYKIENVCHQFLNLIE